MRRSPFCTAGASPAMSKGIVIAGINPFTGSCAITTRGGAVSRPTTVPASWKRRTSPPSRGEQAAIAIRTDAAQDRPARMTQRF